MAPGNELPQRGGDPVAVLLETNRWALAHLLDAMEPLTDQQLDAVFDMGLGSLRKTVIHVLGAMRGWADLLRNAEQRERLEQVAEGAGVADLKRLLDEVHRELSEGASAGPMDEVVSGSRGGRGYAFTRGGVLCHVTTHGVHHRAQCLNMLRRLGVEALPQSSVLEWMLTAAPVPEMVEIMKEMG